MARQMSELLTAQIATPDPFRRLFVAWLDAPGAAFSDALVKWMGRVFSDVEVARGPDVRTDPDWEVTLPVSLRGAAVALICVVGEQAASPRVHLQLGACFRTLGASKPVVPVLLDVPDAALSSSPLGLFQSVRPSKEDFRRLVRDLSRVLADKNAEQTGCQERAQAAAREKQAEQLLESCHPRPCRHSNLGMTEFHAGKAADDEVKLDSQSI